MPTSTSSGPPHKAKRKQVTPLPALFATDTHLLGWQGLTINTPADWNLASFNGNELKGELRLNDADHLPRLELRWEKPQKTINLERSIEQFLEQLARQAKKQREAFEVVPNVRMISKSRKRKLQLINFGWMGERDNVVAGQGWGVAWQCNECDRIVVAHLIGRGTENPDKMQRLATEVLSSLECHGSGGWQTWSVFDLQLDVPEEFPLARARLLTGRIEMEWVRPPAPGLFSWMHRPQRIALTRVAAANVLLEHESLEDWTQRVMAQPDKKRRFGKAQPTTIRDHEGLLLQGVARDVRKRLATALLDRVLRRHTPPAELRVWHCVQSNKLYALDCELTPSNAHVTADVLDSLECHHLEYHSSHS